TRDGVQLVGDEYPADDPRGVALLLHGGGQTRHSWKNAAARLARHGWTSITLDARGHGDSGWSADGQYGMDSLVADLVAVPATLEGLKRNVRLKEDGRWHWHWDPAFLLQREGDQETRRMGYDRLTAAARSVRVPTLLVRGAQSDIVSPEGAAELQSLIPGSRS